MGQTPTSPRYISRYFGGGVYRGPYVHRVRLYVIPQHVKATITPGVGAITVSGNSIARFADAPNQDVHITQLRVLRVQSGSVYRPTVYRVIRRVLILDTAIDTGIGVGSISITGYQPGIVLSGSSTPQTGSGGISVTGYRPGILAQNLLYTQIWRNVIQRVSIGSGVHRRDVVRTVRRRFLYFQTYPDPTEIAIPVGSGDITLSGSQVQPEPWFGFPGAGSISVNGRGVTVLLDGSQSEPLGQLVVALTSAARRRREFSARFGQQYPAIRQPDRVVIQFVRPVPQRILGLQPSSISVTGSQVTLQRRIPVGEGLIRVLGSEQTGAGEIRVSGNAVSIIGAFNRLAGTGNILVSGQAPLVQIDGQLTLPVGVGTIDVDGNGTFAVEAVTISVGAGTVTVGGQQVESYLLSAPGAGAVSVSGLQVTLSNQSTRGTNPGTILIVGNVIGLSTPEKAANPTSGNVVVLGNRPGIISTGYWEQTAGDSTSWSQTAGASDSWSKVATGSGTWTKI